MSQPKRAFATGQKDVPPPWLNAELDYDDAMAVRALKAGNASGGQQQRALRWIVDAACGTYDLGWHPSGPHEASFSAGRRFAGSQVVRAMNINAETLRKNDAKG